MEAPRDPLEQHDRPPWSNVRDAFDACHQDSLNVALHLLTTPLGLLGALGLAHGVWPQAPETIAGLYVLSLLWVVPLREWSATALAVGTMAALVHAAPMSWPTALTLVGASYLLQDLAHAVTGEATFQSTYQRPGARWRELARHTWLLLPLVLSSARRLDDRILRWWAPSTSVTTTHLHRAEAQRDLATLHGWVLGEQPPPEHTTHWWLADLPPAPRMAFDRTAKAPEILDALRHRHGPAFVVERVPMMDEVYVAGPLQRATSDTVFYLPHVDGPMSVFPFCTVYRCMVALNHNEAVHTHFPMAGTGPQDALRCTLTTGDAVAFDFNRELHYITADPVGEKAPPQRVALKVHYVAYPRAMGAWGRLLARLTSAYDVRARRVFLDTLVPRGPVARARALLVLATTRAFDLCERFAGTTNLAYVAAIGVLAGWTGSAATWLAGVSFLHYGLYLGTWHHRVRVPRKLFVRDAVFFKAVSMTSLGVVVLTEATPTPATTAMVVAGFGISALASLALGPVRTWFGEELGAVPPRRIRRFPYGAVPHPMITGAVVGLLGLHAMPGLAEAYPWLVPTHVAFYLAHLVQEELGHHHAEPTTAWSSRRGSPGLP